ncbi:MAG TPA: alpha/beta hydrolase [Gemmatimonadaceae bacterium]|nr:alpha/beta hydrolase [Gemmatimonadaceae bacterium]
MRSVTSRDGTRIAVWQGGAGPALLLVHGATADHMTTWRLVSPALERRFTVYAMDRRGRGDSADGPAYDLQREAEDVAAVIDSIDAPVNVVGHSYGALCAIEAARLTGHVRRLILYEGVPLRGEGLYPARIADRLEALLAAGDVEGMLVAMYRELVQMPAEELELLRAQREAWSRRLTNVATMPRELRAEQAYVFRAERFAGVTAPVLLLVGGDSPPRELLNAEGVAAGLHDARVVLLPGQQHTAMHTTPELFVRTVEAFFLD